MTDWYEDGDILPDVTEDEREAGWGEGPWAPDDDQRLRDERPPHWE